MPKVQYLTRDDVQARAPRRAAWGRRRPALSVIGTGHWSPYRRSVACLTREDCLRILGRDLVPGECIRLKEPLDCPATPDIWHNYPRPKRSKPCASTPAQNNPLRAS